MIDQEILEQAKLSIVQRDKQTALQVAEAVVSDGHDPVELMESGFIPGIAEVGDQFGRGTLFLPELIKAAEVMKSVSEYLNSQMPEASAKIRGRVVIATVKGDLHDIGKSIVVSMFKANGFEVYDLGRDVEVKDIIAAALECDAQIIGTSALLTTTMGEQKKLEDTLKSEGLRERFKTIVGGAPVTVRWAKRIGADAYAKDANEGVVRATEMLRN